VFEKLGDLAAHFAEGKLVRTLNTAFARLIPFISIGAITLALVNLPIAQVQEFYRQFLDGRLLEVAGILTSSTLSLITLAALASISLSYTVENSDVWEGEPNYYIPVITSFTCYVILFLWQGNSMELTDQSVGTSSIFKAIIVSLSSLKLLFVFIRQSNAWRAGKMQKSKPDSFTNSMRFDASLHAQKAIDLIVPVTLTLLIFVLARVVGQIIIQTTDLKAVLEFIKDHMRNGSLPVVLLVMFISQLMAFLGAHNFVLFDLMPSFLDVASSQSSVFGIRGYYLHFALCGGAGATLGLLIAMAIVGRTWSKSRLFTRVSFFPVIFNINEPLLYGFPVILNPFYLIPFIITPLTSVIISYIAFTTGLVPPITHMVDWTTPVLLSGYLATGSLAGSMLQAICIGISVLLYYPFVRANQLYEQKQRLTRFDQMQKAAMATASGRGVPVIEREDAIGQLARELITQIRTASRRGDLPFHMVYQPKVNQVGRVVGAEALLRWNHPELGAFSPLTIVELMDESGLSATLGRWVAATSIREFSELRHNYASDLKVSLNLDPRHFENDDGFINFLKDLRDQYNILPGEVELEITENAAIMATDQMRERFHQIRDLGYSLSIDDMGMGYSSLNYISDYGVKTVKLDMSLIENVRNDYKQREIVRSVVQLVEQLHLELVVEGVETKEQFDILYELGVQIYQGYYFSKPLEKPDFEAYLYRHLVTAPESFNIGGFR